MPDHWQETRIGEVASIVSERVDPTSLEFGLYVGLEHLVSNARSLSEWGSTSDVSSSTTPFLPGDTLFGRLRPYLRKGVVAPVAGVCSPEILVLRGQEGIHPRFLGLLVLRDAVFEECNRLSAGSRMPRVSAKDLMGLSVLVPPLAEQHRIVDIVKSVDSYIDCLQTQVDATRAARSAVLWELLSSPGNDWQETTLGSVTALVRRGRAPAYANEGLLVLNQKCIRSGNKIDYSVARRTDVGERPVPEWAIVRDGDVLVNSTGTGTAGRAALVARHPEPMTVDSHITIVRSLSDRVVPEFIGARLSAIAAELEGLASGSTNQIELSRQALADLPLHLPPLSDQQRIVDLVGAFDKQIAALESQIAATRIFRGGVLSELLSGERVLDESYDVKVSL